MKNEHLRIDIALARLDLGTPVDECRANMPKTKDTLYAELRRLRIQQRTDPKSKYIGR